MDLEMNNYFENLHSCIWFEGGDRRNVFASILAGFLFFSGWWLIIDANALYPDSINGAYYICGIIGTLSLFMINSVSNAQVRGDAYSGGCMGPRGVRAWLFMGFVLGFAAVIASCLILFANFTSGNKEVSAGMGLFLQNVLILAGSLVYKFGRTEDQF